MVTNTKISNPATPAANLPVAERGNPIASRSTVKRMPDTGTGKKPYRSSRKAKTAKDRKSPGKHVRPSVYEASRILGDEGYRVFRNHDQEFPFHLDAWKNGENLFIRVGRPNDPIFSAALAAKQYICDICRMMAWRISPSDLFQFWIFSRQKGLLRYQVYDWGIGNVVTMQKLAGKRASPAPVSGTDAARCPLKQSRTTTCPVCHEETDTVPD